MSALALSLYLFYLVLRPFLPGIAWAIFLSTAFYPLYTLLQKIFRKQDWAAAILATLLVASILVVPTVFLLSSVTESVPGLLNSIHAGAAANSAPAEPGNPSQPAQAMQSFQELERRISLYVNVSKTTIHEMAERTISKVGSVLATQMSNLVQNALRTLLTFSVMIFTMGFLFHDGHRILDFVKRSLPLSEQDRIAVFDRLKITTRAVFYGIMMTALIQGVLAAIGWKIAGLPKPLFFGMATFFSAFVPIGGTALVWGGGAIYLFTQGDLFHGIILTAWGVLLVSMVDNFVRPIFISGRTKLHMLLVFFGVFGGLMAFGIVGLFMGPLIITLVMFLLEVFRRDLVLPSPK